MVDDLQGTANARHLRPLRCKPLRRLGARRCWIGRGAASLPSFHSGGWVGSRLRSDETLAKLQTGEFVLSRQHVAGLAQVEQAPGPGAPSVQVHIASVTINREADVEQLGMKLGRSIRRELAGGV